jgi:NADH-quinone oxidoreductase subunit B
MDPRKMAAQGEIAVTRVDALLEWTRGLINRSTQKAANWARANSIFPYPFVTACCGMEFMSAWSPRHDVARYGSEFPRFSPRQADLLMVVGTVTQKQAPVLRRVYDQMAAPKWVMAFGACASTGGFYQNYAVVDGIDLIVPVDVYIPGCPPRPEQFFDGLLMLQEIIKRESSAKHPVIQK